MRKCFLSTLGWLTWTITVMGLLPPATVHADDLSFWGVDGHMTYPSTDFNYLEKMAEQGVSSYGIEFINWKTIVPDSLTAQAGPDAYNWTWPDRHIRLIEQQGGTALVKLWCRAQWATGQADTTDYLWPPQEGPPSDPTRYWDYWGTFCHEIVERYDGDGYRDMGYETPEDATDDLQHGHLYFQIQGESEWRWQAAPEKYGRLLEVAHDSMKAACEDVQVLYSSFNLGNYFDDNPSLEDIRFVFAHYGNEKIDFVQTMLSHPESFDIAPTQLNHDYTGLPARVRWLTWVTQDSLGYERPIWFVDAQAGYPLNQHPVETTASNPHYEPGGLPAEVLDVLQQHPQYADADAQAIMVDILQRGSAIAGISADDYQLLKTWWEADKACFAFKKTSLAAALGVKHIYSQWILENSTDPCLDYSGWATCALLEDGVPADEMPEGTERPVYYAMGLFREMVDGFDSAQIILPGNPDHIDTLGPLWDETWLIEFSVDGKQVFVAWADGGDELLDLSPHVPLTNVRATPIVTEVDAFGAAVMPTPQFLAPTEVPIGRIPVLITPLDLSGITGAQTLAAPHPYLHLCTPSNPTGPLTLTIDFGGKRPGADARLAVYNVSGRLVRTLAVPPGDPVEVRWDGTDNGGHQLAGRILFYSLTMDGRVIGEMKTVILR